MMTQQSKKQREAVRCYSRSLYYKPQKKFVPVGSGKQMLYVLNIMVRYSLIYVSTKDRQFLTFIHSFIHLTYYFKPIIQTLHSFFIRMLFFFGPG